jgi:CYTH domain-containing protein
MDPSAYIARDNWLQMIQEIGVEESDLRDHRYDCVVHLVSAAKGAEAFYSSGSNSVRSEGIQVACELDTLVMNAWVGHASLQVVDNISVSNFAEKCDRVVQAVLTRLGFVADHHRYGKMVRKHKFVVKDFKMEADFPVPYRDFMVDHFYLVNTSNDGMQIRIRKRQQVGSGSTHLNMTIRHSEQNGQRVETRRNLSFREFEALRAQADPTRVPIKKYRRCFLYKDRYYQMDVYQEPFKELILLEGYLDYDNHSQSHSQTNTEIINGLLPEWLNLTEVTKDKNYSMFSIASRSSPFVDKLKMVLN